MKTEKFYSAQSLVDFINEKNITREDIMHISSFSDVSGDESSTGTSEEWTLIYY